MWRLLYCLFLLLTLHTALIGQHDSRWQQAIPFHPSVRQGILGNGMRYFILPNAKPEKRAELRLAVRAGSLQEDDDQAGLAHFVEHLAFNGTRNFQKNELIDFLELAGTRFGPDLNAYTSFGETAYLLQTRTDSMPLLEKALLILEDWASGLSFDAVEVEKERGVVLSEWRTGLSPDQRQQQQYFPVLYRGSRYAERLPIGDTAIIRTAPVGRIRQFYQDWYRPELMAVIAVGDFDLDWMENEIRRRFSPLDNPSGARRREDYQVPIHPEAGTALCFDPESSFTQVRLSIKHLGRPEKTYADWKFRLMAQLYNNMLNARMLDVQQQPDPPFTFAYSGFGSDIGGNDVYYLSTFGSEQKALEGFKAVLAATWQAKQHGFTTSELERQKAELLRYAEKLLKEQNNTTSAGLANGLLSYFLQEVPFPSPEQVLPAYQRILAQVSLSDINELPKQWLSKGGRTLVITAPEKAKDIIPGVDAFLQALDDIEKQDFAPYHDEIQDGRLLSEALAPIPIQQEVYQSDFDVTALYLPNGVRIILKPTDFKNDEILMTAFSPGGHSLYADEDYPSAANAIAVVSQSGVGQFSYAQLTKKLTGKTLSVGPYIGELDEGFNGNCAPGELEEMLQLIYLYCAQPRVDSTALLSYLSRQRSVYQNMMINPYYYYGNEREKIKYNHHPRRGLANMAELDQVRYDKIVQVIRDRFGDAGDFTFVFVGKFNVDSIKTLLATYLGNLPTKGRKESYRDIGARLVEGIVDSTIVRGQAPKAIVELTYHGTFDHSTQNRYHFSSLLSILRIQLRESLREEKSGVYGVNIYGNPVRKPRPEYRITISFNADPAQCDSLIRTLKAEIYRLQAFGPTEQDLAKVRETQLQTRLKDQRENSFWLGQLAARYEENASLEGLKYQKYKELVDTLDANAIQCEAQRYFNPNNLIQLVLMPEGTSSK